MKKILVVENSPTIISVADSLLRQRGYDVTCLSDGKKALAFAKAEKPDLILTAVILSGLDGVQLCREIMADVEIAGIPVILLVGEKDADYADDLDTCGARGIIKKPFSPKELLAVSDKFAGINPYRSPKVIDQNAPDGPRLKPRVAPQEIGTSTKNVAADRGAESVPDKRHETVFNLEWGDLKDDPDFMPESKGEIGADDSGLVLEEDQYGLTRLSEETVPAARGSDDEDYDWFVGEMKKEIEGNRQDKGVDSAKKHPEKFDIPPDVSYEDLDDSTPISKDDAKYRQFLNQFKKDATVLTEEKQPADRSVDVDWLVDRVADKLAQKIVDKLDKNELKRIIGSMLSDLK